MKITPLLERHPEYQTVVAKALVTGFAIVVFTAVYHGVGYSEATSLGGQALMPILIGYGLAYWLSGLLPGWGVFQPLLSIAIGVSAFSLIASLLVDVPEGIDSPWIQPDAPLVAGLAGLVSGATYGGFGYLVERIRARDQDVDST